MSSSRAWRVGTCVLTVGRPVVRVCTVLKFEACALIATLEDIGACIAWRVCVCVLRAREVVVGDTGVGTGEKGGTVRQPWAEVGSLYTGVLSKIGVERL